MKVKIDRDLCIGVSNYVAVAPTVFKLDDEKSYSLNPSSVDDDTLLEAAESVTNIDDPVLTTLKTLKQSGHLKIINYSVLSFDS